MSELGQNRKSSRRAYVFRFTPESGLKSDIPPCPYRANSGSGRLKNTSGELATPCASLTCDSSVQSLTWKLKEEAWTTSRVHLWTHATRMPPRWNVAGTRATKCARVSGFGDMQPHAKSGRRHMA